MENGKNIGLAFQGGCFLAGAIAQGVVHALVDKKVFDNRNINAFSGTSAGALVAAMCWKHKLLDDVASLPDELQKQWLENANGFIPTQEVGERLKLLDRWLLLNPLYFEWKDKIVTPYMHKEFEGWLVKYVEPEKCMQALFDKYIAPIAAYDAGWREKAQQDYDEADRPRLVVGTAEIHQGEIVTPDDEDLFAALVDAFATALGNGKAVKDAERQAVKAAGEYMKLALMTSGSLDTINGMTEIGDIEGISSEALLHKGHYLDGAWGDNPPISDLTNCAVNEIWMVEIFAKRCLDELDSNEKREDRREELSQSALVEHQRRFINKVNFWLETGRLRAFDFENFETRLNLAESEFELEYDTPDANLEKLKGSSGYSDLDSYRSEILRKWQTPEGRAALISVYKASSADPDRYTDAKILRQLLEPHAFTDIKMRVIELPSRLQPLTDGARIVNSPAFLIDMMNIGYQNTLKFLDQLQAIPALPSTHSRSDGNPQFQRAYDQKKLHAAPSVQIGNQRRENVAADQMSRA